MSSPGTTPDRSADPPLRLAVLDEEDLAVVSAHLQDAEGRLSDMAYLPRDCRFAMVLCRFDWPLAQRGRFERCRVGLHFERVLKVERSGFPTGADAAQTLLAITFHGADAPSGTVLLTFAAGAQIRLTVECLEAEMRDLPDRWPVPGRPAATVGLA